MKCILHCQEMQVLNIENLASASRAFLSNLVDT